MSTAAWSSEAIALLGLRVCATERRMTNHRLVLALMLAGACALVACDGSKREALEAADGPGLLKLPLRGLPGEDKALLAAIGASEEGAMKRVLALAAGSAHAARLRCHALQSEAVDVLVLAARKSNVDVDAEGDADTSGLVPRLRVEGLIPNRNYTLHRTVDGDLVRWTALGAGEMAGDEWKIEKSADPSKWIEAGQAVPAVVKDACAGK
jgi:hypothetical protein